MTLLAFEWVGAWDAKQPKKYQMMPPKGESQSQMPGEPAPSNPEPKVYFWACVLVAVSSMLNKVSAASVPVHLPAPLLRDSSQSWSAHG